MTITAPITIETQHDDIEVDRVAVDDITIIDDIQVVETAPVASGTAVSPSNPDAQLMPFLILGLLSWIGIVVAATLLAF